MGKKRGREGGEAGCWKRCVCTGPVAAAIFGIFLFLFWPWCCVGCFCEMCFDLFLCCCFVGLFLIRFVLLTNWRNTVFLCRNPLLRSCPMPSASHWAVHPAESLFTPCSQKYQRNLSTSRTLCKLHLFFCYHFFPLAFAAARQPRGAAVARVCSRLIIILFLPPSL